MHILPFDQGSPEWHEFRKTHIGASDIGTIMAGTQKEIIDLYKLKVEDKKTLVTDAMARGSLMEEEAIKHFFGIRKKIARPCVQNISCDWLFASLDGYHEPTQELLEVKCPSEVPDYADEYPRFKRAFWQIQAQLYCTGLEKATLYLYSPLKQTKKEIWRDDPAISRLTEKGHEFYERLIYKNPPEEPVGAFIREDDNARNWARAFREIDEKVKELEEHKKVLRDEGIAIAADVPFECEGVVVSMAQNSAKIDYEAACKAHGIDVSGFIKRPKMPYTWRITAR